MAMQLDKVVPFGRTLAEYQLMFSLTERDFQRRILDIGAGPASFTAEMYKLGYDVTAIDPIYHFTGVEIQHRFDDCVDNIIQQVDDSRADWVWKYHKSPADLRRTRELALELFLADYDGGKVAGRYIGGEVPDAIGGEYYDLILCSHFLLLYSSQLDWEFHRHAVTALLEHGKELRIFPLLTLDWDRSPYINPMREYLDQLGYHTKIVDVEYEFQPGGNQMLVIKKLD